MQDLVISGSVVDELGMSPSELMIELAVYLYDKRNSRWAKQKSLQV